MLYDDKDYYRSNYMTQVDIRDMLRWLSDNFEIKADIAECKGWKSDENIYRKISKYLTDEANEATMVIGDM